MIWTILGLSVGIVAFFCVTVAEFLVGNPIFEPYRPHAAVALGVLGGFAWLVGRIISCRSGEGARRFLLFDLRYWGPMLVVLGVITLFIRPLRMTDAPKEVAVKKPKVVVPAPAPAPKSLVVEAPKIAPHTFPQMKVQGLFYRSAQPVVILNGQSYVVGDQIGDVMVKAIDREGVLLESGGETKLLTLN